jgi:hypothetical protein
MRKIYRDKGLLLIPLPGNKGLNIGRYFTGYCTIRDWPWAVYDFADHVSPWSDKAEWAENVLEAGYPKITYRYECWKCTKDHYGSADNMEEIRYIQEDLNVKVRVID